MEIYVYSNGHATRLIHNIQATVYSLQSSTYNVPNDNFAGRLHSHCLFLPYTNKAEAEMIQTSIFFTTFHIILIRFVSFYSARLAVDGFYLFLSRPF